MALWVLVSFYVYIYFQEDFSVLRRLEVEKNFSQVLGLMLAPAVSLTAKI